ncbi:hypothetical protein SK3146_00967 [Paenibacillus konkukensis]|uniref:Uncharacterized protein n=1 Tax=Paenibacillus konkukensis TaxID=2020716 RepID=A0ABY4RH95_9BACL|nr:hypothetical protein [Paenibacillus konkukensis]UQZ81811.1 hypothetical protein SK3146_00967 [Paenibacillus konkukensis]
MTRYTVFSADRRKSAEVTAERDEVTISLRDQESSAVYFEGRLQEMLCFSVRKPWSSEPVRLNHTKLSEEQERLVVEGDLSGIRFSLRLGFDANGLLRISAAWENRSGMTLRDAAAGLLFPLDRKQEEKVTIPHMIYNNNPSSDPQRIVPKLGEGAGRGFLCEEHRLPIPAVNAEWREGEQARFLTLFSLPSYVETPDGKVHYGSLGALQEERGLTFAAMSGVLMMNGEKDVVYVSKSRTQPYDGGYLDFAPGFALEKEYALHWGAIGRSGQAFREVVRAASGLFAPEGAKPHTAAEIVRLKSNALDDRWRTGAGGAAGYIKFTDSNSFGNVSKHPLHYMYGWTGQCLKLAWCDAKLGFSRGEGERIARCVQAASFYVKESETEVPGIRHSSYMLHETRWDDFRSGQEKVVSSRAYGETIADLGDIILLFREQGRAIPEEWVRAVCDAADLFIRGGLQDGILPAAWDLSGKPYDNMITAAGLPCLIALVQAYRITRQPDYLAAAEAMMQCYYELHAATFDRPFARSTLDAKCEDKEAGMYFFLAAYHLYKTTGKPLYEEWAQLSAEWLLTFVYMWNPVYDKGSMFREAGFQAAGWPGVSVQNHHLDVFFPTFELWDFGRSTGRADDERWGRMIFDALGQGICTKPGEWKFDIIGEQAEGFFQTNWNHRGHSNKWNPSWVIALMLQNAIRFQEAELAK